MKTVFTLFLLIVFSLASFAGGKKGEQREPRRAEGKSATLRTASARQQDARDIRRQSSPDRSRKDPRDVDRPPQPGPAKTRTSQPEAAPSAPLRRTEPVPESNLWERQQNLRRGTEVRTDHRSMFENVRSGLNAGRISSFSDNLAPQVHINLRGGESGYFSSSQAYYVLENYLQTNRFSGLEFTTMEQSGGTPYATGRAQFDQKGVRERAQVYISLTQVGERWVISQIKIY